jgi:GNAT superfamily N-acetyltransferase
MGVISAPELLAEHHDIESFDCGKSTLNEWLNKKALKAQKIGGSARIFVVCDKETHVIGYYGLSTGAINRNDAPGKVKRNMPNPIPVVILGRLAVSKLHQGQGIGPGLLRDALLRVLSAAELIGIRAVLVHTLNDNARNFYRKHGFYESPTNDHALMITIQDIQASLKA